MIGPDMTWLNGPGGRIAARITGPADGVPVLLIAGWPQSMRAWHRVVPLLADAGFRTLALDPPGLSESDLLAEGASYATSSVADMMAAAVASFGLRRYGLVGHDVGAWIAYAWACRLPAFVSLQ